MVKVLFVCMGNICRSPTAHGVFENMIENQALSHLVEVDSAGTHAYHVGEPPDGRATATARQRGVDLTRQRARKVVNSDFDEFDYVLAMDSDNLSNLHRICPAEMKHKVKLFLDFAPHTGESEVPDPYYGGQKGFEHVFDLVEAASNGLLEDIRARHLS